MLTYEDCIGLCELTEEEVEAIAQHEHIPEIVAAELGRYLVETPDGVRRIRRMILDDIDQARRRADVVKAAQLRLVLRHFVHTHPLHGAGGTP